MVNYWADGQKADTGEAISLQGFKPSQGFSKITVEKDFSVYCLLRQGGLTVGCPALFELSK